ncbi:hypothetical protein MBLNU459_g4937t1 [Dothideomycetes sp. NU459]
MPPTIFVVRHAQGYHNIKRRHHLRDPHITGLGHEQCIQLRNSFPHHDEIDIIMASPLMRTIETASLVFEKALDRRNVPFMLVPMAQEIANQPCDIGFAPDELKTLVRETLAKENVSFDVAKIDFSLVEEGWNSKKGIYEASLLQVEKRAASLRAWLWRRPEKNIVLVSHGAFLHYFSEDWTFFDGAKGTAYENSPGPPPLPLPRDCAVDSTVCLDRPRQQRQGSSSAARHGNMWDDEDNNPYGSFNRRDSEGSDAPGYHVHAGSSTPPSGTATPQQHDTPDFTSKPHDLDDEELDGDVGADGGDDNTDDDEGLGRGERRVEPRKGGYDSRIEQILYENPDLEIQIVHAGKNTEGGGGGGGEDADEAEDEEAAQKADDGDAEAPEKASTRTRMPLLTRRGSQDLEVRRRYSEFASLRQTLVSLHPTLIIPPIPEKHSITDYAAKPTKAKEDVGIIELRQRMLATFLNRCRRMQQVRDDGVWWRFLDPNASWNEVLHSHPVVSIPKNNLKAPPLDPANPSPGHTFLPVPSASAKLRAAGASSASSSGTPASPPPHASQPSIAAHTLPGPQVFGRFPPDAGALSEAELDPYFVQFEASSRELEALLQGSMEKVNQRSLQHLYKLGDDLMELGGRYNAFSLSEQSPTVAAAIEKTGQACDFTYIQTRDLSSVLSAQFAEPMRESAQFAGIVRNVLRYRVLKRVQEEMTRDQLEKQRTSLESLEKSEMEARRIEQYLSNAGAPASGQPRRAMSTGSNAGRRNPARDSLPRRAEDDTASIDSDFPPTHGSSAPSADQGAPQPEPASPTSHRRGPSGGYVTNKIFGRLTHALHSVTDSDPERARRDQIGKTRESLVQLEQALEVSEKDVKDASAGVLGDLKRFQSDKEDDLRKYMVNFARCHVEWAKRSLESWEEAKAEVHKIEVR